MECESFNFFLYFMYRLKSALLIVTRGMKRKQQLMKGKFLTKFKEEANY